MSHPRRPRYRPSFLVTPGVVVTLVLRVSHEMGRPCAVLPDGSIVTRPGQRTGGALRLFSRDGRELDAHAVNPYTVFEPHRFCGASFLEFRSGGWAPADSFVARSSPAEVLRFPCGGPSGYSPVSRTFYSSGEQGSQLYALGLYGERTPRWASTIGLGMLFDRMESFAFHPASDHAAVAFGSHQRPGGWHSRIGVHVPGASGLEYARLPSPEPHDRIRFVAWVGDEAWWVSQNGTVYAWSGDGQPRDRWAESSVSARMVAKLGARITQVATLGQGLLAAGDGRLFRVDAEGHVHDACGATPMSFDSSWYTLGDRYVTVFSEGGKSELALRTPDGDVVARLRVKPNGWPDAQALEDGGIAVTSEASSYVDVAFCNVEGEIDGEATAPGVPPECVQTVNATLKPAAKARPAPAAIARRLRSRVAVPPCPAELSPNWFRLRTTQRSLPFAFRPDHPTTLASRDMAIFAAGQPDAAREVFDTSLLDAFDHSWRTLAEKVGELPDEISLDWAVAASASGWLSLEFRGWGDLLAALWAFPLDSASAIYKSYPPAYQRWAIPGAHWQLPGGSPKAYLLEELVICDRVIAEVSENSDDPWEEYPRLTVPHPNLGPQLLGDDGLVMLLPRGWGFQAGSTTFRGLQHDELRLQRGTSE